MKIETLKDQNGKLYDAYVVPQPDGDKFYIDVRLANASGNPEEFVRAEVALLSNKS